MAIRHFPVSVVELIDEIRGCERRIEDFKYSLVEDEGPQLNESLLRRFYSTIVVVKQKITDLPKMRMPNDVEDVTRMIAEIEAAVESLNKRCEEFMMEFNKREVHL
jgi:hypothetical protein